MVIQHFAVRWWQNKSGEKKKLFNYWSASSDPSLFHRTCWRTVPEDAAAESSQQTGSQRRVVHDNNDETLFLVKSIFQSMSHFSRSLTWIRHGENGEKRSPFLWRNQSPWEQRFLPEYLAVASSRWIWWNWPLFWINKEQTCFTILNCVNYRLPKKYCYLSHYLTASNYADYIAANSSLVNLQRHSLF